MSRATDGNRIASPLGVTLLLCGAEILGLTGLATFSALLPKFRELWALSNTRAGWLTGVYYAAYVVAVPVLTALTDHRDARKILLLGLCTGAAASLGFAVWTDGFGSALVWRFLSGISLAGIYMPGLKLLSDHTEGPKQSRYVSFYTASFSLGTSLSYFLAGEVDALAGWRWAFAWSGLLTLAGVFLVLIRVPRGRVTFPEAASPTGVGIRGVLKSRGAMAYILGYAAHMWELFSMRAWMVAFLAFCQGVHPSATTVLSPNRVTALINLIGLPASIGGNELCRRFGRRKTVTIIMLVSAALSVCVGFSSAWPYGLVVALTLVYGVAVLGDSASLTAGAVASSPPGSRGATLAVHSTLGFGAAFLGPLAVGVVLDFFPGDPAAGWAAAFILMGAGCALGPVALMRRGR
ncbi:MAG TPA: MFS transporter [Desulfosarcina sp.]|nr:MFS transporter [Desulfosarcina sp.]